MGNFSLGTQYEENVKKKYLMSYMLPDSVRNHKGSDPDTYFSDWPDPDPFFRGLDPDPKHRLRVQ